jgi:hypothetical protein
MLFAQECNERYFACRFLTVDADIEHNESVLAFYSASTQKISIQNL